MYTIQILMQSYRYINKYTNIGKKFESAKNQKKRASWLDALMDGPGILQGPFFYRSHGYRHSLSSTPSFTSVNLVHVLYSAKSLK